MIDARLLVRTMCDMSKPKWSEYDSARGKPRINLTMSPTVRIMADDLARNRGVSVSALLEALVIEEFSRLQKKKHRTP